MLSFRGDQAALHATRMTSVPDLFAFFAGALDAIMRLQLF
jgi:hypothetical protein